MTSTARGLLAQPGRPTAEVTPIAESRAVHAGTSVRLALQVALPDGVHVQANRPRDPLLIPTVLTLEPSAGVTLVDTAYPAATEFKVTGQSEALVVFEQRFVIGAKVALASTVPETLIINGRLRYQACNASTCFAPTTQPVRWTLPVVAASAPTAPQFAEVFAGLTFNR